MTDNEIIKALECCITDVRENVCHMCAFYKKHRCSTLMLNAASDLINRQKAEIERLDQELGILEEELEDRNKDIYDLIFKERSNAILEFAEALKQEADNYVAGDDFVTVDEIDNLVKEMTEVEK